MTNYQVRLPPEMDLDGLLKQTTAALLRAHAGLGLEWKGGRAEAEREIRKVFEKHVFSFDTCGCSSICDEQVTPSEWNPGADSRLISSTPADREAVKRYHLRALLHGGLDSLAESSARYLVQASGNQDSPQAAQAQQTLAQAFRASLGPYLFRSELCMRLELCRSAQPVDAWHAA